ncbi:transporter substrate-binding domain-containing protein [Colwellia asteriadis]|uniref:Transporter substrate-binding domain-containing protein n=1 Tax=Colwellia asteriadis TaxID=517723 RepID=A0ABN1L541_9GAMM
MTFVFFSVSFNSFGHSTLKCATTHYPPYTIYNPKNNTFSGLDMDIIYELSNKLDVSFSIDNLPWSRLKSEISKGNYDCYFSLGKFKDREEYLEFTSIPMHITKVAIFYTKGVLFEDINFTEIEIGVHRGINLHKEVKLPQNFETANIRKIQSNEALFEMLRLNRLGAVVTSYEVGKYILKSKSIEDNFSTLVIEGYELPVYLAFTKNKVDVNKFNSALRKLDFPHF